MNAETKKLINKLPEKGTPLPEVIKWLVRNHFPYFYHKGKGKEAKAYIEGRRRAGYKTFDYYKIQIIFEGDSKQIYKKLKNIKDEEIDETRRKVYYPASEYKREDTYKRYSEVEEIASYYYYVIIEPDGTKILID